MNLGRPVLISTLLTSGDSSWATLHISLDSPAIATWHLLQFFKLVMYPMACVLCSVTQLCVTLWDPMDCSPPVSFVRGILQARILEWVAISFSRGSPWPRDRTHVSCIGKQILYPCANLDRHSKLSPASIVLFLVTEPTPLPPRFNMTQDTQLVTTFVSLPCHWMWWVARFLWLDCEKEQYVQL